MTFRKKAPGTLLSIFVLWIGPSLLGDTSYRFKTNMPDGCSCVSPDGSCSLSISCQGGCLQHCAENCWGECSSADSSGMPRPTTPPVEKRFLLENSYLTQTSWETTAELQVSFLNNPLQPKTTCSIEKTAKRTCFGRVSCPSGCTSAAGSGDTCFLACRADVFSPRISLKFSQKTGDEIASALSQELHQRITFKPLSRYKGARYDLEFDDDDAFNALNFLARQGIVKFNGLDLREITRLLQRRRNP
jgi:hypothetical protein